MRKALVLMKYDRTDGLLHAGHIMSKRSWLWSSALRRAALGAVLLVEQYLIQKLKTEVQELQLSSIYRWKGRRE